MGTRSIPGSPLSSRKMDSGGLGCHLVFLSPPESLFYTVRHQTQGLVYARQVLYPLSSNCRSLFSQVLETSILGFHFSFSRDVCLSLSVTNFIHLL